MPMDFIVSFKALPTANPVMISVVASFDQRTLRGAVPPEMVRAISPKLKLHGRDSTFYDPCCGTGGFLIEAFRKMKRGINEDDKELIKEVAKLIFLLEI